MAMELYLLFKRWHTIRQLRLGDAADAEIVRGKEGMGILYALYAGLVVVIYEIDTSTEIIKDYRVFWIVLHSALMVHLFFFNSWFRNLMIKIAIKAMHFVEQ
jgi:hypothetical protein